MIFKQILQVMNFGLGGVYFMHISEGKGWKQRPDE